MEVSPICVDRVPRVDSLTGSRFLAALAVLWFHVVSIGQVPSVVQRLATYGRCGVCFFFVLSGFVMTLSYTDMFKTVGVKPYFGFVLARFSRIVPMHVLALLLITPLCIALNDHGNLLATDSFKVPTALAARSWVSNLFLVNIYHPRIEYEQMWNAPSWSVACEVVFYLLFPFLISLLQRWVISISKLILLAMVIWLTEVAVVFAAIAALQHATGTVEERSFDFIVARCPLIRLGEFAVGCCSSLVYLRWSNRNAARGLSANRLLLFALLALGLSMGGLGMFPHFKLTHWCLALTPASAIAIIALATRGHVFQSFLQNKLMLLLGESSYALYLLQWTAVLFFRQRYSHSLTMLPLIAIVIGCVAASVVAHLVFERPVCRMLRLAAARVLPVRTQVTTKFADQSAPAAAHLIER